MSLTQRQCEAAKPKDKPYRMHHDDPTGLYLFVKPDGTKQWKIRYRVGVGRAAPERNRKLCAFNAKSLREIAPEAHEIIVKARKGEDPLDQGSARTMTVGQMVEEYYDTREHTWAETTKRAYDLQVRKIKKHLGRKRADNVRRSDVARMIQKMPDVLGNRTARFLSQVYDYYIEEGELDRNPVNTEDFNDEKSTGGKYLTKEQMSKLQKAFGRAYEEWPRYTLGLLVLALTGCRPGEVFSLRWNQLDFDQKIIQLQKDKDSKTTKAKRADVIHLSPPLVSIFSKLVELKDDKDWIFPAPRKDGWLCNWNDRWRKVREWAGIEDVRLYDLRHNAGSWLGFSGMNAKAIQGQLRHANLQTTQIYTHSSDEISRQTAHRLAELLTTRLLPDGVIEGEIIEEEEEMQEQGVVTLLALGLLTLQRLADRTDVSVDRMLPSAKPAPHAA